MTFWILITALALACAAILVLALLRHRNSAPERAEFDIAVYRDQLAAVDRDLARGVITQDAAERTRNEVSRRILEADGQRGHEASGQAPRSANFIAAGIAVLFLAGGSLGLYASMGAPGYGDLALKTRIERAEELRAARPSQSDAEEQVAKLPNAFPEPDPQFAALVQRLRETLAERPDDLRGLELLSNHEAALGNYPAAYAAQSRIIAVKGAAATSEDFATMADLMIIAAGGFVSPEAEAALVRSLELDPRNGPSRYYSGLMRAQNGRPDIAFQVWRRLLEESRPEAPWVPPIQEQIGEMAMRAGVEYTPPQVGAAPLRGPSSDDVNAAADMSPEDRMDMIRGMVDGLSARLAEDGGTPSEWAQLITALGVLGESDRARAIFTEGLSVFGSDPSAVDILNGAAEKAGVGP